MEYAQKIIEMIVLVKCTDDRILIMCPIMTHNTLRVPG